MKKRVVHLIKSLDNGGCENFLLRTLPLMTDFEHVVVTLDGPGELAPEFERKGVPIISVGQKALVDFRAWRRLREIVKRKQPDVIITYLFHADVIGRLFLSRILGVPVVPFLRTTYNAARYWSARFFERLTRGMVDRYFANSEAVKDFYVQHLGVTEKKITVIPNGINVTVFGQTNGRQIRRELRLSPEDVVISCVANLARNKGHRYLVDAFEQLYQTFPGLALIVVGTGPEAGNLKRHVASFRSKERVFFLGRRQDVPSILATSDIFALPTLFEGMSNALLEAMAAGLAVVTTDIPENRVLITDRVTGLLVKPANVPSLQEALRLVVTDHALRSRLQVQARRHVQKHFQLSTVAQKWSEILRSI